MHFLLGTSDRVSTIADPGLLAQAKEGWSQMGLKARLKHRGGTPRGTWDSSASIPWKDVRAFYHSRWNLSKPLLVECSPPEILRASELHAAFAAGGKVRFLLLVRSACSKGTVESTYRGGVFGRSAHEIWAHFSSVWRSLIDRFGDDVYVLRFEDICLRWPQTLRELTLWEPRLAGIDITRLPCEARAKSCAARGVSVPAAQSHPSRRSGSHHLPMSVAQFCMAARARWENTSIQGGCLPRVRGRSSIRVDGLRARSTYLGYQEVDACVQSSCQGANLA